VRFSDTSVLLYAISHDPVLSEDLGDGQDYAGIRVINPFR